LLLLLSLIKFINYSYIYIFIYYYTKKKSKNVEQEKVYILGIIAVSEPTYEESIVITKRAPHAPINTSNLKIIIKKRKKKKKLTLNYA
jgi:hypothetical protein